jgi:hypothetical protein
VCAVAFSGSNGRTAVEARNTFSLDQLAMSTANLYAGPQPGAFLLGIPSGPMVGKRAGAPGTSSSGFGHPKRGHQGGDSSSQIGAEKDGGLLH